MNSTETLNEQEIGKMLKLNDPGKAFHSSRQSFWECFTHSAYTDTNIVFKDGLLPVNKACFAALSNNLKFCIEDVHDSIIVPDLSIHSFDDVLLTFTEHSIAGYGQLGRSCFSEQFHQTLEHLGVNLFTTIENFNSGFAELTKKLKTAETNLQIHIRKQKSKSFYCDPQERTAASIFGINEENTYSAREVSMVEGKHSDRHKKTRVRAVRANKMKAPRLCSQILHDPSKIWDSMNNSECMKEFLWCDVCTTDQQFVSSQDLETHMRKHHQYDGRVMTCTFCHCPCMGEEAVVVHEQTLCKNKGNRCVYCEVKHPNRQALLDHMLEQHGTGEQKYCYVCKTSFKVLKANYVTEWPHLESCLESDGEAKKMKVLQTKEDEDWEDLCNTSQTSFLDKCLNCSKDFTSLPIKSVLEHFLKKAECRSDERNRDLLSFTQQVSQNYSYYCEKCGASFKEEDWLERHLATHKEHLEYFDCKQDSCKFKFITELALDLHTSSFHPDAKLECSICKSMVPKGDFKDHVISHAVQCKQCEKIFAHKGVLNNHILSVHDEKHKRIQRLKQKRFDEESSQQRHQMNNMQPHEATVEAGEVPHGLRNPEQLMNQVGQSSQNQIAVVHPSIIAQPPYQQIVVPVTHIQHLNVNQMSHFLQINNSQDIYKASMEKEEDPLNKAEHAKFLLYQLEQDINSSRINKDCLIQCSDGSYLTSSVILCSLSKKMFTLMRERSDFDENPLIIVPSLGLGELLLFFKYFFSNKVEEMFNSEDTKVLQKVCDELEIDFVKSADFTEDTETMPSNKQETDALAGNENNNLQCTVCSNTFITQELLSKHILLEHPQSSKSILNQCKFCNEIFLSEDECNCHIDQVHQNVVAKTCEKLYKEKRLKQQEKLKSPVSCTFCSETVNFSLLSKHIKQKHPENEHTCLNCGQINANREDLEKHIQVHNDANEWYLSCERCPKICLSQYQLQVHRKTHNIKQFGQMTCPHCDRIFQIADKFKKHVESHETGKFDKSFPCVHCTKSFKKQYDLGRHLKSHLGIKSHTCDSCGAQFVDGTRLKQHKWIHLNHRAFKCTFDSCQESFRHKSHLKSHIASFHTDSPQLKDKMFDCHLCNRKFAYQYKLKNHIDWHAMENYDLTKNKQKVEIDIAQDESIYVCAICHAEFITIDELGKHCKVHYQDNEAETQNINEDITEILVDISSNIKQTNIDHAQNSNIYSDETEEPILEEVNEDCQKANKRPTTMNFDNVENSCAKEATYDVVYKMI